MSPAESHSASNQTPRVSQGRIPQTFTSRHSSWSSTRPKLLTPGEMIKMCFLCVLFVIGLGSAVAALFFLVENLTKTKEVGPTVGTETPSSVASTVRTSFNRLSTEPTTREFIPPTLTTKTSTLSTEETVTTPIKSTVPNKSPTVTSSSHSISPTVDYHVSTNSSLSSTPKIFVSTISKTNTTRRTTSSSNSTKTHPTSQSILLVSSSTNGNFTEVSSPSYVAPPFHPRPKPYPPFYPLFLRMQKTATSKVL